MKRSTIRGNVASAVKEQRWGARSWIGKGPDATAGKFSTLSQRFGVIEEQFNFSFFFRLVLRLRIEEPALTRLDRAKGIKGKRVEQGHRRDFKQRLAIFPVLPKRRWRGKSEATESEGLRQKDKILWFHNAFQMKRP